jgi:hypothetical protein
MMVLVALLPRDLCHLRMKLDIELLFHNHFMNKIGIFDLCFASFFIWAWVFSRIYCLCIADFGHVVVHLASTGFR